MADSINLMLDEMVNDLKWLMVLSKRFENYISDEEIIELAKLQKKYFNE